MASLLLLRGPAQAMASACFQGKRPFLALAHTFLSSLMIEVEPVTEANARGEKNGSCWNRAPGITWAVLWNLGSLELVVLPLQRATLFLQWLLWKVVPPVGWWSTHQIVHVNAVVRGQAQVAFLL